MVAYHHFVELSHSGDSEERGRAAHLAALAYLGHQGPADEQAALYALLIGFLDDPSVKVRAALAFGLLHAPHAPRPVLLALLRDATVISRAIAQYSPALVDADLVALVRDTDPSVLMAICLRDKVSARLAEALIRRGDRDVLIRLLDRMDVPVGPQLLRELADRFGDDAAIRGALLERADLPAETRLALVEAVGRALLSTRLVAGAIAPQRLERLIRNATDAALTSIGENEARVAIPDFATAMVSASRVSTRVLLHALVYGRVLFFADCIAELSEVPQHKVFAILEEGSPAALAALLGRCGLAPAVCDVIGRLVLHARAANLAEDAAARHYVVTVLTEDLIIEHSGDIPPALEDVFCYLCEQNVALARQAARGVMAVFAEEAEGGIQAPEIVPDRPRALPAA